MMRDQEPASRARKARFVIVGPTVAGNMGGTAMIVTAVQQVARRSPTAEVTLLSYTPAVDRKADRPPGLKIVSADYRLLVLLFLPLSIMAWPLRGLAPVRRLLMTIPYFRAISEADAVIDLCGISFSDGRGLPLLVYNVACCLPALAMGTPVMKLSQAFGPFEEVINRKLATFVLSRCSRVVARGEVSRAHLRQIGFPEAECLPDTSFTLEVGDDDRERARALLQERGVGAGRLTIVSPSEVVRRLSAASSCDFESEMERLLRGLDERGDAIVLLPHSVARDNTKNNDIDLCRRLKRRYGGRAALIDDLENPVLLRAILGEAHIHIGCRFHSVVGALAMGVPTMIIGWSHKYKEMAAPLQGERWALSWEAFEAQSALRVFDELSAVREEVHAQILSALPFVRERAANNYEWLDSFLPLCQRS